MSIQRNLSKLNNYKFNYLQQSQLYIIYLVALFVYIEA